MNTSARMIAGVLAIATIFGAGQLIARPNGPETAAEKPKLSKDEMRVKILAMRDGTLQRLYSERPALKKEIEEAPGYAVLDSTGLNVLLLVANNGAGVAVEQGGKPTYMRMVKLGTGAGLGYKEYKVVFVFKKKAAYDSFITNGLDLNASIDAVVKPTGSGGEIGGQASLNQDLSIYQLTDKGLLLQVNYGGTKYYKDPDLNEVAAAAATP